MFHKEQTLYHHKAHIHHHLLQCHQSFHNNQVISQASCHHEVYEFAQLHQYISFQ